MSCESARALTTPAWPAHAFCSCSLKLLSAANAPSGSLSGHRRDTRAALHLCAFSCFPAMAAPTAALSPRTRAAREMMTDGSFCSDVCVRVGAQGEAMALHRVQVRPKGCRGVPWAASVRAPLRMARRSLMRVDTHTDKCIQRQRARRGRCLGAHGAASCCPTGRGSDV